MHARELSIVKRSLEIISKIFEILNQALQTILFWKILYWQKITLCNQFCTLKKQRLKIIELEKVRFIRINEVKLAHVELL